MSHVLALDVTGIPNRWIDRELACVYYAKGLVAWEIGDDAVTFRGGENRITGKQSTITTAPIIAIKGESKGGKRMDKVPSLTNRELFRRDRCICAYCGQLFSERDLTRDHIHPVSKGGLDIWMNVVAACDSCNHRKGNKLLTECRMELLYVPYTPNRAEGLMLAQRRILACQTDYLLSYASDHFKSREELERVRRSAS
jgi:5-methylcytosine-specific restriction endonuclease McrA